MNTDSVVSWGGSRNGNWTNSQTFGAAENCTVADFKSEAWNEVAGRELMIEDRLVRRALKWLFYIAVVCL